MENVLFIFLIDEFPDVVLGVWVRSVVEVVVGHHHHPTPAPLHPLKVLLKHVVDVVVGHHHHPIPN